MASFWIYFFGPNPHLSVTTLTPCSFSPIRLSLRSTAACFYHGTRTLSRYWIPIATGHFPFTVSTLTVLCSFMLVALATRLISWIQSAISLCVYVCAGCICMSHGLRNRDKCTFSASQEIGNWVTGELFQIEILPGF